MKNSLRRLTALAGLVAARVLIAEQALVALAQPAPVAPLGRATEPAAVDGGVPNAHSVGDGLLIEAAARLERRPSITARLRHLTVIDGQQLYGVGRYWQLGNGDDMRVRLELELGREASLLQISNGRFLWCDRSLPTGRTVTRVDLRQLRFDPVLAAATVNDVRPGRANWSPAQSDLIASSGGLPRMLAALQESFSFYPPQAMRLVIPAADGTSTVPYFAIVGRWKTEKLAALVGHESKAESQGSDLLVSTPERLPQEVLLLFGQADLFPYRIEYRRLQPPPIGGQLPPPTYQLSDRPSAVLEFFDVTFNAPIPPSQFDYVPPTVDWVDHTAAVIEQLRRKRQQNVAIGAIQGESPQPIR
jgi:hypothetical protein